MLIIRSSQMEVLADSLQGEFLRKCERHLSRSFDACARMSASELRTFVEQGVARARSYGIDTERDLCRYLNLVAVLGRDFDLKLPWARKTLASGAGARLRLNRLYNQAVRMADAEAQT